MKRSERRRLAREQHSGVREDFGARLKRAGKIPFAFAAVFTPIAVIGLASEQMNSQGDPTHQGAGAVLALWLGAALTTLVLAIVLPYRWARQRWGTVLICSVSSVPIGVAAMSCLGKPFWLWSLAQIIASALFLLFYGAIIGLAMWYGEVRPGSPGGKMRREDERRARV